MIVETPTEGEIHEAMEEFARIERLRIARDVLETGDCPYCGRQTLRCVFTGARWNFRCPCNFKLPPA